MVVHGVPLVQEGHIHIEFDNIFRKLFGIRHNMARDLHMILTRTKDGLFDIVKPSEMIEGNSEYDHEVFDKRSKFRNLIRTLDLDQESYEWIRSLT